MISWLQRSLQRHYKWLFSIMLVVIIISFVFTIGAAPKIGQHEHSTKKQMFFGHDLNSNKDMQELGNRANISYLLNTGRSIPNAQMAQEMALSRPPIVHIADLLQIPEPNEDDLVQYIQSKPVFKNPTGKFDSVLYENFLANIKQNSNLPQRLISDTLDEDYRIDAALNAMAGPGYVNPFEAQVAIEQQETLWSVVVASMDAKDLKAGTLVTDATLEEYYKKNKFTYAIPPRVKVSYITFPSERYINDVEEPTESELQTFFDSNLPTFAPEFKAGEKADMNLIRDKVLAEYRKKRSHRLAAEAGNDFLYVLYERGIKKDSLQFNALLASYKLSVKEMPAYTKSTIPEDTPLPRNLLTQAFSLSDEQYYSDLATSKDGYALLFYKATIPSEIPPMQEIKDRLKEDYLASQSLRLLETKGKILAKTLRKALNEGAEFRKLARDEGLQINSFEKFQLYKAPEGLDRSLLRKIQVLDEEDLSDMILTDQTITFIYVEKKETPKIAQNDKKVQELMKQLSTMTASATAQGMLQEMIEEELPHKQ